MRAPRVVLDTNVWLDWLVFHDPAVAALREAQADGRIEIVIDDACEAELAKVLAYDLGARSLDLRAQTECLDRCRGIVTRVSQAATAAWPECRDPDDRKFLALASAAGAAILVSRDRALLALARRVRGLRIVTPECFEVPS